MNESTSTSTSAVPLFVARELRAAIDPLQRRIEQLEREVSELKRKTPAQPGILERLVRRSGVGA